MRKLIYAFSAAALLAVPATASATDYKVTGGKLDWTQANYFASGDNARTWLGYATRVGDPARGFANGWVTAVAPATITGPTGAVTTVDGTSPRLIDSLYTFGFPVSAGGTYSDLGVGTVDLSGTLDMEAHEDLEFKDPRITLNGLTGTLTALGKNLTTTLDHSKVQFDLDLSNAQVIQRADGSKRITGIVPVGTAHTAMAGFPAGQTRFGTMSLTLAVTEEKTPAVLAGPGATGPAGPAGIAGPAGAAGRDATLKVVRLAKAAFATKHEVHVRLIDRKTKKSIALGTVEGRTLRLSVLSGTTLKGSYTLKRTAKKASGKLQTTITIK